MFRLTTAILIAILWGLAPLAVCQTDEFVKPSREWLFQRAKQFAQERPDLLKQPGEWTDLMAWCWESEEPVTDSMRMFIEELADEPTNYWYLRQTAVWCLRLFKSEQQVEKMRQRLSDPVVQVPGATLLVEWGYWDDGSPVLIENEEWWPLVRYDSARAEPILRKAIDTGSPYGRMNAAGHLARYGDSLTKVEVARAVLQQYVVQQETYPDSINLGKATYRAYEILCKLGNSGDISLMEAGLRHNVLGIRLDAVYALFDRAQSGDERAISALRSAAQSSNYRDVKDRAELFLSRLGQQ